MVSGAAALPCVDLSSSSILCTISVTLLLIASPQGTGWGEPPLAPPAYSVPAGALVHPRWYPLHAPPSAPPPWFPFQHQ
jgi:hypothetical protein